MSSKPKPLRLRSACTECYVAKVRCSGDKDGCHRCRRNRLTCEYEVSMVGRASKKRRTQNDQTATLESQFLPLAEGTVEDSTVLMTENFTNVPLTEDVDSSLQEFLGNYTDTQSLLPSSVSSFWLATDDFLPDPSTDNGMLSGIEQTLGSGESEPRQIQKLSANKDPDARNGDKRDNSTRDQTVKSIRSRLADHTESIVPSSYRDRSTVSKYPHAATLMAVIESLEEQLQTSPVAIDQAMRLNRQSIKRLREVSNTEGFRNCQSCPLLMTTIMDLVVGLYEVVIITIRHPDNEGAPNSSASQEHSYGNQAPFRYLGDAGEISSNASSPVSALSSGSEAPLFKFGCLEFDPDEQEIFRAAMIRRDLRKCKDMIRYCSQEGSQRKRKADALTGTAELRRPVNGKIQANSYKELEWRIEELLISLPFSCGHS